MRVLSENYSQPKIRRSITGLVSNLFKRRPGVWSKSTTCDFKPVGLRGIRMTVKTYDEMSAEMTTRKCLVKCSGLKSRNEALKFVTEMDKRASYTGFQMAMLGKSFGREISRHLQNIVTVKRIQSGKPLKL